MYMQLRKLSRRFARDEDGTVISEAVIMLPLLCWAYVALFVYWDAYRSENTAVKASYTIADMITREIKDVDDNYITGLQTVFDFLLATDQDTGIVVSSVTWVQARNRYEVLWSEARGTGSTVQGTASIQNFANRLPNMTDGDTVIVVQTNVEYVPLFDVGVPTFNYDQFIVTRPRRTPKINCPTCGVGADLQVGA